MYWSRVNLISNDYNANTEQTTLTPHWVRCASLDISLMDATSQSDLILSLRLGHNIHFSIFDSIFWVFDSILDNIHMVVFMIEQYSNPSH